MARLPCLNGTSLIFCLYGVQSGTCGLGDETPRVEAGPCCLTGTSLTMSACPMSELGLSGVGGETSRVKEGLLCLTDTAATLSTCLESDLGLLGVGGETSKAQGKSSLPDWHLTDSICLSGTRAGTSRYGRRDHKGQHRSALPDRYLTDSMHPS